MFIGRVGSPLTRVNQVDGYRGPSARSWFLQPSCRFRGKKADFHSYLVMKISTIRRKNLGEGPLCSPSEWAKGWFAIFDAHQPEWRKWFDPEAIVLTLVDIMEDDTRRELDPVRLDAFTELLAHMRDGNPTTIASVQAAVAEVCACPRLPGLLERMSSLFRPGHPLNDPSIRTSRRQVAVEFLELTLPYLKGVLNKISYRKDWEERELARRCHQLTDIDLDRTPDKTDIGLTDEALSAAAERTIAETKKEISPDALKALRNYLSNVGTVTKSEAARSAGVAPSTFSRALEVLQEKTERELGQSSDRDRLKFATVLQMMVAKVQKGNL